MNKLIAVFFVLLASLGASFVAQSQALTPAEPLDRIVAVVEEDVILQSELDRTVGNILAQYRSNPSQLPPRADLERQVLDNLIMLHLQVQRAESTGIRVTDTEVDQAMQRVAENNKIDVRQMRAQLEHDGVDYDDFRKTLKDQLLVQRLRQRIVQSQVNITDSEVDILLASNSLKSGEVHLAHILVGVKDGASADEIQAAKVKADSVKKQIDDGMDFSAAALRYSNAQDALQGGDLGWRRYDEVPEAFSDLAEGMQPGQVSAVMRGPSGYHIVKLVDKRSSGKQVVTEYHARHIQISVNEVINSDEAQKSIRDIRRRATEGNEDFAKLAKQYSQDNNTANLGGDMGWFPIDQYGTKVAEALAALKDNEVSQPFQTDVGWHIVQRLATREQDRTQQMKREQAMDVLRGRKSEEEFDSYLRQMRSEAYACAVNTNYSNASLPVCGSNGAAAPLAPPPEAKKETTSP